MKHLGSWLLVGKHRIGLIFGSSWGRFEQFALFRQTLGSNFFANSGFYTNRLRWSEVFESFRVAGFEEIRSNLDKWDVLPIQFQRLHKTFLSVSSEDLLIKGANITLIASK